jgi:hypothetical protein
MKWGCFDSRYRRGGPLVQSLRAAANGTLPSRRQDRHHLSSRDMGKLVEIGKGEAVSKLSDQMLRIMRGQVMAVAALCRFYDPHKTGDFCPMSKHGILTGRGMVMSVLRGSTSERGQRRDDRRLPSWRGIRRGAQSQ